jgi:hypothetical protein
LRIEGSGYQKQIMKFIRSLEAIVQIGFKNQKLLANAIVYWLWSRVEGQYSRYLNMMVIQMISESKDILKDRLRKAGK